MLKSTFLLLVFEARAINKLFVRIYVLYRTRCVSQLAAFFELASSFLPHLRIPSSRARFQQPNITMTSKTGPYAIINQKSGTALTVSDGRLRAITCSPYDQTENQKV